MTFKLRHDYSAQSIDGTLIHYHTLKNDAGLTIATNLIAVESTDPRQAINYAQRICEFLNTSFNTEGEDEL